jgi:hypothetical protein
MVPHPDTQAGNPRGQLRGTKHSNKGTKFSFFKSYYVYDTAFMLLSRGELIAASKLMIVSHYPRFGLTIHTGVKSKNEDSKTEDMHFPRSHKSSVTDMENIEIDEERFMSFCIKFKYLGTFCMPKLNDTADITGRISQARKYLIQ